MMAYSLMALCSAFIVLGIGILALLWGRDRRACHRFFIGSLAIFVWNSPDFFIHSSNMSVEVSVIAERITYLGGLVIVVAFAQLTDHFIQAGRSRGIERWFRRLGLAAIIAMAVVLPTSYFLRGMHFDGVLMREIPGPAYRFFWVIYLCGFGYNLFRLWLAQRDKNQGNRAQLRLFFLAAWTGLLGSLTMLVLAPKTNAYFFGMYSFEILYSLLVVYAIMVYDLMSVTLAAARITAWLVVSAAMAFGVLLTFLSIHHLPALVALVTLYCVLALVFGGRLQFLIYRSTERFRASRREEWERAFETLKATLVSSLDRDEILECIVAFVAAVVGRQPSISIFPVRTNSGPKIEGFRMKVDCVTRLLGADHSVASFFLDNASPMFGMMLPPLVRTEAVAMGADASALYFPIHSIGGLEVVVLFLRESGYHSVEPDAGVLAFLQKANAEITVFLNRLRPYEKIQQELQQALELAAVSRMIIAVNHEINSPLTVILVAIQKLNCTNSLEAQRWLTRLIESEARRIGTILHALRGITPATSEYLPGLPMTDVRRQPDSEHVFWSERVI